MTTPPSADAWPPSPGPGSDPTGAAGDAFPATDAAATDRPDAPPPVVHQPEDDRPDTDPADHRGAARQETDNRQADRRATDRRGETDRRETERRARHRHPAEDDDDDDDPAGVGDDVPGMVTGTATGTITGKVFLGISVDGYIARPDGDLTWLTTRGEAAGDAGYTEFMAGIDAVVLGRTTYQVVAGFSEWPYGQRPVHVLSSTLPVDLDPRVTVHRSLPELVPVLEASGATSVYLDGGLVVRSFLAAGLVDELTLSQVPVLLGQGVSLFGPLPHDIDLQHVRTQVFGGGMVQTTYRVSPGWNGS